MNINKCIFCGNDLASYKGYITDGKMGVCNMCAGRYTLARVMTRLSLHNIDTCLKQVFESPIDITSSFGLNVQTDDVEDESPEVVDEIAVDIENMSHDDFFSKYADNPQALQWFLDANGEPSDSLV